MAKDKDAADEPVQGAPSHTIHRDPSGKLLLRVRKSPDGEVYDPETGELYQQVELSDAELRAYHNKTTKLLG